MRHVFWLLCLLLQGVPSGRAEAERHISAEGFAAEISGFQQLAQRCALSAEACVATTIPDRQQVDGFPAGSFPISWGWLQDAFGTAKTAPTQDRERAMEAVGNHLTALLAQAGAQGRGTPAAAFDKARTAANAALAREEFRTVTAGPGWFDRQLARAQDAILRMFSGMGQLGQRAPWLAPAIEWCCFGLAAGGLLWFVRKSLARQTLRIALSEGAALAGHGERDAADWARQAEQHAADHHWREAVHCLYWAAIAYMESRKAWRPNSTRTPREYLGLLRPESAVYRPLRDLTRQFELIWYGDAATGEDQYRSARESYQALEAARPERTSDGLRDTGTAGAQASSGGI